MTDHLPGSATQRLDKWLFFARLFKSRALAQAAIEAGQVSLNGKTAAKAADPVHVGDRLIIQAGPRHRWLTVAALGTRRGPAPEARNLYAEE
jgi:ribosome-associated heat shock protein Hsp15